MTVDEHIQRLLEGDRYARDSAAIALRALRVDPQRLAPVLAHPHVSRQVKAIEVLRHAHVREAVELLVPMLGSPEPLVARKAASALGRIGKVAPDLIARALDTATTPLHRLFVLDALSRLRHPRGREVLIVQADAWEPWQRSAAIHYLRRYRDDPPVATIRAALFDRETRDAAIDTAGKLRDPSFLAPLLDIWLGDERFPPIDALFAIGKYGEAALVPILERTTADRARAADAIRWVLMRADEALLWRVWQRPEPAARDACLDHLGSGYARSYAAPARRAALAEHVRDPDPMRRRWCVTGCERLGERDDDDGAWARAALAALASDRDEDVRSRAETALRSLAMRRR